MKAHETNTVEPPNTTTTDSADLDHFSPQLLDRLMIPQSLYSTVTFRDGSTCLMVPVCSQPVIEAMSHPGLTKMSADTSVLSYVTQNYAEQVLEIMNDLRKIKNFCDVILTVDSTEIQAHRLVLAASSKFFRDIFAHETAKAPKASLAVQNVDEFTLNVLVDFAYTGNVKVGLGNVRELLTAACFLEFLPVRDACCDFMERCINPNNCVGIRCFAEMEHCDDLVTTTEDYINRNFSEVTKSDEFLMLSFEQVEGLLKLQSYPYRSEEVISESIHSWINHDHGDRAQYFPLLFKHISLEQLTASYLITNLAGNELVKNCKEVTDLVLLCIAKMHLSLPSNVPKLPLQLENLVSSMLPPTSSNNGPPAIITPELKHSIVSPTATYISPPRLSNTASKSPRTVQKSPSRTNRTPPWTPPHRRSPMMRHKGIEGLKSSPNLLPAPSIQNPVTMVPTVSMVGHIPTGHVRMSTGHATGHIPVSIGEVTKAEHDTELRFKSPFTAPASLRSPPTKIELQSYSQHEATGGEKLFVVGGASNVNMTDAIRKVECYDPLSDSWSVVASLNKSRSLVGVTVLGGELYAVGGYDGMTPIDSVECYSHKTDAWTMMGRMISARRGAGVTTLDTNIYAVGGFDGTKLLSLAECYHSDTNSWTAIAPLRTCRFALGAADVRGRIYAVGGYDGHSNLSSVDVYDPNTNVWSRVCSMSVRRYAVGVTSLNGCIYAVGGLDGTRPLATVERYDPRENSWFSVAGMSTQRAGVDVTVLGNSLYAVGGILGSSPLETVERYDIRMNTWLSVCPMSTPRVDAGASAISTL